MIILKKQTFNRYLLKEIVDLCANISSAQESIYIARTGSSTSSAIQTTLYNKSTSSIINRVIRPIIMEACLRSEVIAAGSGEICLKYITNLIPVLLRTQNDQDKIFNTLDNILAGIYKTLRKSSKRSSKESIKKHINNLAIDKKSKFLLTKALGYAGKSGKVILEKSTKEETSIIISTGCNFNLNISPIFLGKLNKKVMTSVNCVVIDGIVLEVSEIHHLLEIAHNSKEPFIIFAREFSPDVLQTITTNFISEKLNVIPVCIPLSESRLNMMVDVAVSCGTDVISSYKGDTISSSVINEIAVVDKIICTKNSISIENKSTDQAKLVHINTIEKKLISHNEDFKRFAFEDVEKKREMLKNRLSSMSSETITISIGKEMLFNDKRIIEKLDTALREVKAHTQLGYIHISDIISDIDKNSTLLLPLIETLSSEKKTLTSITAIASAVKFAHTSSKSICTIDNVLFYN
jgi:hypothetical protein